MSVKMRQHVERKFAQASCSRCSCLMSYMPVLLSSCRPCRWELACALKNVYGKKVALSADSET